MTKSSECCRGLVAPGLILTYRSEESGLRSVCAVSPPRGGALRYGSRALPARVMMVFVSVNQVLVRLWTCRLRDGLPCRAVGRLAAEVGAKALPG